jgi:monolysocardiolipin acyltransferase
LHAPALVNCFYQFSIFLNSYQQYSIDLSAITLSLVLVLLSKSQVFNKHRLEDLIENRPKHQPLLTYGNHYSCGDDPGIWGNFKLRNVCSGRKMRWSIAAHDICFTNFLHSAFFMSGKTIAVVRGAGVYQPAIDLCIEKLKQGEWVHIFPEGKVNMEKEYMRFKWGIGRILYETYPHVKPIILPIWHEGMSNLLPNYPPYYPRLGNKLTFNFGQPIDISATMKKIFDNNIDEVEARRLITEHLQNELNVLRVETEELHRKF